MSHIHKYILAVVVMVYFASGLIVVWASSSVLYDVLVSSNLQMVGQNSELVTKIARSALSLLIGIIAIVAALWLYTPQKREKGIYAAIVTMVLFWGMNVLSSGWGVLLEDKIILIAHIAIIGYLTVYRTTAIQYEANALSEYLFKKYGSKHSN